MKQSKVDFDDFTENYNKLLHESTGFFSADEAYFAKYKVDILQHVVSNDVRTVLEYGCGIGRNIPFLSAAFPDARICGLDISSASLEVARATNPGVDFFLDHPSSDSPEAYDVIFIAGVFHHIPVNERRNVMRTLRGRLSPNGTIVIFEHNPYNPITRRIVSGCPYDKDAVLLKPSELVTLLSGAGFRVTRKAYCLFMPPFLSILSPLEGKIGWLPLGGQYWVKATYSI